MNISRIRRMITEGDMSVGGCRYLLDCAGECEHLDYKSDLEFDSDYGCAELGKDAVGMKNTGGGYIVIGVEDKTWNPIGLIGRLNLDTKMLRDKIRKSTGLDIEADIVHHNLLIDGSNKLFAFILIRASTKRTKLKVPSICKINFHPNENWGLRIGDIYVRDGDQTKKLDSEIQLQNLLDDLETKYQEADLEQANALPSPFAVETGLYRLLPQEFDTFIGRESYLPRLRKAVEQDPRIWIINLHGAGGVGKSALATWIAYKYFHEKYFEAILHLSGKDLELLPGEGIRRLRPTLFSLEDFLDRILHLFSHEEYCSSDLQQRKNIVIELLSAFHTLLILDNMETVGDGRIMDFVRDLPPGSRTKVLLTSRRRTSDWEFPIQVSEFDENEIREFLRVRSKELKLDIHLDDKNIIQKIAYISGGLPLAIQWTLGEYAKTKDLDQILSRALNYDSPLLEFSFRNSWNVLDENAKKALAVLAVFDEPPTSQLWRMVLEWPIDRIEKAIGSLIEVTFVTERTEQKTGIKVYQALPITLSFARNELAKLGDLERQARLRYQDFRDKIELASVASYQCQDLFKIFDAKSENEKKSILLCRMAEGQARSLGYDEAEQYYKQALEFDPRNVYTLVSYGLFKLELHNYGDALELMKRATERINKKTGFYVYFNLARVYEEIRDHANRARYLRESLKYDPNHVIARHSLGVTLGRLGNHKEAVEIFDGIIDQEFSRVNGPSDSLEVALRTKMISLKRMNKPVEAGRAIDEVLEKLKKRGEMSYLFNRIERMRNEELID